MLISLARKLQGLKREGVNENTDSGTLPGALSQFTLAIPPSGRSRKCAHPETSFS